MLVRHSRYALNRGINSGSSPGQQFVQSASFFFGHSCHFFSPLKSEHFDKTLAELAE